jgi:hypothetical protein
MKPSLAPVFMFWAWSALVTAFWLWWSYSTWLHCLRVGHDATMPLVFIVAACVPLWAFGAFFILVLTLLTRWSRPNVH